MPQTPRFQDWTTLPAMFFDQAERLGDRPLLRVKRNGTWERLSWRRVADQVVQAARGLAALGVGPGDRVCIVAENRPEWLVADMAIMAIGAVTVPAYTTIGTADYEHVLANSGAGLVLVSGQALTRRVFAAAAEVRSCLTLVTIGDFVPPADPRLTTLTWDRLLELGRLSVPALPSPDAVVADLAVPPAPETPAEPAEMAPQSGSAEPAGHQQPAGATPLAAALQTLQQQTPAPEAPTPPRPAPSAIDPTQLARQWPADGLACIIYTSGTGGAPKGVMLSHRAVLANCRGAFEVLKELGLGDEVFLSCLPLSHAYEHSCGQMFPLTLGAEIAYVESLDRLAANFAEVQPTIVLVVPRLMEVVQQRMVREIDRKGGLSSTLFHRTIGLGRERYENEGGLPPHKALADWVLTRLVRRKVQARLGGRIKALVSGGAALNPEVGVFFESLGLTLLQGYGQTEAAPLISVNRPSIRAHHTVGPAVHGCEVRIVPEDNEIIVRGPNVMLGYWDDPASTERALEDGWLHTGDVGLIDEKGRIVITDRKKDILVTSGGDNISPARVEGRLTMEPEIAQAVVCGDKRPYLVALLVPDGEIARAWAKRRGKPDDLPALCQDPDFRRLMGEAVDRANRQLPGVERIRKWELVPEPFTIDNGLMTPTMKIRRTLVQGKFQRRIIALYEG